MEKQKGEKHPLLCYFASYFSCRIEKKKARNQNCRLHLTIERQNANLCAILFFFPRLENNFPASKRIYIVQVFSLQCTIHLSSCFHYSRLKNNLHPRDSRSAKLRSHQRRNPNYLKRILKARKVNNRFCRKLALVFRKHHQHHQCHNSALKKSQRTNVDQITIMLSLTEVCRRYAVEG